MKNWTTTASIACCAIVWTASTTDSIGQTLLQSSGNDENLPQSFRPQSDLENVQFANAEQPTAGLRRRGESEVSGFPSQVLPPPQSQQFTTGLPYVTPPPGRYPTSPYTGPRNTPIYRPVGYSLAPNNTGNQPGSVLASAQLPSQYQMPPSQMPPSQIPTSQALPNQSPRSQAQPYQAPRYQTTSNPTQVFSSNPAPGIYQTGYQQCQVLPPPSLPPDGATGQPFVPPPAAPNSNPGMYSANNQGYRPLFSLGQEKYNVVLGRGIVGQPTAYVPGQCIRNFLRYISP